MNKNAAATTIIVLHFLQIAMAVAQVVLFLMLLKVYRPVTLLNEYGTI